MATKSARMPLLFRFLATYLAFGLAAGGVFTTVLLMTNAAGLRDLLEGDGHPIIAKTMLYIMMALTFGSLAMGAAVMLLPRERRDSDENDGR